MEWRYKEAKGCTYIVAGREKGEKYERDHWQCYAEFVEGITLSTAQRRLEMPGAHMEKRRGTAKEASDYCKKDGDYFEKGEITEQGKRSDLATIFGEIDNGRSVREISREYPTQWAYHRKAMNEYKEMWEEVRDWKTQVILLWGPTGTGKTRRAIENGATQIEVQGDFINGYNGEDIVVFDDISPWTFRREQFLKLFDRYAYRINIKGGDRNWKPKKVYLTTNYKPEEILLCEAMKRRVDEIILVENYTEETTQK